MNLLDSRVLTSYNCYIQKVLGKGELVLDARVASAGFAPIAEKPLLRTKVKAATAAGRRDRRSGKQLNVPLAFSSDRFTITLDDIAVDEGDALLFHLPQRKVPSFSIRGRADGHEFTSVALEDQAVFTHPFGIAGDFEWGDANGSGVGGVVHVVDDPADGIKGAERSIKHMSEGVLVHIVGKKVEPEEITIATGQTVFFAVEETKGITITDRSLLRGLKG